MCVFGLCFLGEYVEKLTFNWVDLLSSAKSLILVPRLSLRNTRNAIYAYQIMDLNCALGDSGHDSCWFRESTLTFFSTLTL